MADYPANCGALNDALAPEHERVRVLLPLPLPAALDYRVPDGEPRAEPGRFVRVTLGSRRMIGVVWEGECDDVPAARKRSSRAPPLKDQLGVEWLTVLATKPKPPAPRRPRTTRVS